MPVRSEAQVVEQVRALLADADRDVVKGRRGLLRPGSGRSGKRRKRYDDTDPPTHLRPV